MAEVTVPMAMHPLVGSGASLDNREGWWSLDMIGRLKPGVSLQQARADLDVIFQQFMSAPWMSWMRSYRQDLWQRVELTPAGSGLPLLRRQFSLPLRILMMIVGLVLLIACSNVANLLLARATARQREIAVRLAIGAGRARLIRQLLTESVLLAGLGGAVGLWFAWQGSNFLLTFLPQQGVPMVLRVVPDARILGFTAAVSLLTGLLFGLAPAFRATRIDLTPSLKENARSLRGPRLTLAKTLVIVQVALSLLLLVGAGLFIRTLQNLKSLETGFLRDNVLLFTINTYGTPYARVRPGDKGVRLATLYRDLLARINALPGVRSASLSAVSPMSGGEEGRLVNIPGFVPQSEGDLAVQVNWVGLDYFETMRIPLLLGRDFSPNDEQSPQRVAIVTETIDRRRARDAMTEGSGSLPRWIGGHPGGEDADEHEHDRS